MRMGSFPPPKARQAEIRDTQLRSLAWVFGLLFAEKEPWGGGILRFSLRLTVSVATPSQSQSFGASLEKER